MGKSVWSNSYDPSDADTDLDGDGLTNKEEHDIGTLPNDKDTDGDGFTDYDELRKYETDPKDENDYPKSALSFFLVSILFVILGIFAGYYRRAYGFFFSGFQHRRTTRRRWQRRSGGGGRGRGKHSGGLPDRTT